MECPVNQALEEQMRIDKQLSKLQNKTLPDLLLRHKTEEEACRKQIKLLNIRFEKAKAKTYRLFSAQEQKKNVLSQLSPAKRARINSPSKIPQSDYSAFVKYEFSKDQETPLDLTRNEEAQKQKQQVLSQVSPAKSAKIDSPQKRSQSVSSAFSTDEFSKDQETPLDLTENEEAQKQKQQVLSKVSPARGVKIDSPRKRSQSDFSALSIDEFSIDQESSFVPPQKEEESQTDLSFEEALEMSENYV